MVFIPVNTEFKKVGELEVLEAQLPGRLQGYSAQSKHQAQSSRHPSPVFVAKNAFVLAHVLLEHAAPSAGLNGP